MRFNREIGGNESRRCTLRDRAPENSSSEKPSCYDYWRRQRDTGEG